MTTPFICARCSLSLLLSAPRHRLAQRNARAKLSSLRLFPQEQASRERRPFPQTPITQEERPKPRGASNGKRKIQFIQREPDGHDGFLEELFRSSAQQDRSPPVVPPTDADGAEPNPLTTLEGMLSRTEKGALARCWVYFREHYGSLDSEHLRRPSTSDRSRLARPRVVGSLLRRTIIEHCKHGRQEDPDVPSPADAVRNIVGLGLMREEFWTETLWRLLCHSSSVGADASPLEDMKSVLNVWKVFFETFKAQGQETDQRTTTDPTDWACIPNAKIIEGLRQPASKSFEARFFRLFPNFPNSYENTALSHAAAATFDRLTRSEEAMKANTVNSNRPFVAFMAQVLAGSALYPRRAESRLAKLNCSMDPFLESIQWQDLPTRASVWRRVTLGGTHPNPPHTSVVYKAKLERALQERHVGKFEALWEEVTELPRGDPTVPTLSIEIYNSIIQGFMSLRRPSRAVSVWHEMTSRGLVPTQKTWNALMGGGRYMPDSEYLEEVWKRMTQAGVNPDVVCWTTRIHALMCSRDWRLAVRALNDMGQAWLEATKKAGKFEGQDMSTLGDIDDIVKPTKETVNAALSGLLRKRQMDVACEVLTWADSLGIKSDIVTYNTLLRPLIRTGQREETQALLQVMEQNGIKPDIVTFTMILDGLFPGPSSSSSTSVGIPPSSETIVRILAELEASGIPPNQHSYSALVDGLIKVHGNLSAAQTILTHMSNRGIKPSIHIYTMLLTHHLAQHPPDLAAVDALWKRITTENRGIVDSLFLDRIVEGYAHSSATHLVPMQHFLARMFQRGDVPSWRCLCAVLAAFFREGEVERARILVGDVRFNRGNYRDAGGPRGHANQEPKFWRLVGELGFAGEEGDEVHSHDGEKS